MKKRFLSLLAALMLTASLCGAAEYDWGAEYAAYYLQYDEGALRDWSRSDYADSEGVLLYMYRDEAEVSVSLPSRSDAPGLDDLADLQLQNVQMYGTITREPVREDWYAPWDDAQPGMKLTYGYTFGRTAEDAEYRVAKYMAPLNDDKYVMIEVLGRSGDIDGVTEQLEESFLRDISVGSFMVSGGGSAYLTGADEKDGQVYLTLQPFDVMLSEDGMQYSVQTVGEPQVMKLSPEARILAPMDQDAGMLEDVEINAKAIESFIDGYRQFNGTDCVFNWLMSDGVVRWMTVSYLY